MILLWFVILLFTLIGLPAVLVLISRPLGLLAPTVGFPQPRISNPWPFLDLYQKEGRGKQRTDRASRQNSQAGIPSHRRE